VALGREIVRKIERIQDTFDLLRGERTAGGEIENFDGTGHRQGSDLSHEAPLQLDLHDLMRISTFTQGERKRRAAEAHMSVTSHLLSQMQMPEGGVCEGGEKEVDGEGMLVAAEDLAFAQLREAPPCDITVSRRHKALPSPSLSKSGLADLAVKSAHPLHQRVVPHCRREIGRTQKRDEGAESRGIAEAVAKGNNEAFGVKGPVRASGEGADDADAEGFQKGGGSFESSGRIVVSPRHGDIETRKALPGLDDKAVEESLCRGRRVGRIEDVAGNDEGIGAAVLNRIEEPGEKLPMFVLPGDAVQGMSEVPVGGVQNADQSVLQERRRKTVRLFKAASSHRPLRPSEKREK
jgi:hypothetical protein